MTTRLGELRLVGGGGEPVDLRRTLASHGVATLPPQRLDEATWVLEATLAVGRGRARTVRVSAGARGRAAVELLGGSAGARDRERLLATVRHMLRLDEDLSPFYAVAAVDDELAWAAAGAGRMLRSPTVFEDVVKTVCTTNCSWALTTKMTTALVERLGDPAPDGRRAFPSAAAMASPDEAFYREVVRAGYRAPYLRALASSVAGGEVDLESLTDPELPDDEAEARLLALPGIGPYGAAHVMLTSLGRYSRLVLDSWTRPTYARLAGRKAKDSTIERRFRRYREWAGLAFWLYLTRDWVKEET
ncbi:MAG: DNA-3-methyladenine glycosylase family protein [Gaiellaceae bacterium]